MSFGNCTHPCYYRAKHSHNPRGFPPGPSQSVPAPSHSLQKKPFVQFPLLFVILAHSGASYQRVVEYSLFISVCTYADSVFTTAVV